MYYINEEAIKMEEKIKIYIPKDVNNILLKDMERFEFFKKDGTLNRNEFYNTLIINYYEQYQEKKSVLFSQINESIRAHSSLNEQKISDIAADILQCIDLRTYQSEKQKYDISLSIKPTRRSSEDINYIQNCLLDNSTLSNYFRNMFSSYTLLPQDKRETIIFKQNFDLINEALKNKTKLYFTTQKSTIPHIVSPYKIANSKEELFNYLLCEYNDLPYSFRMSRIRQVKVLNEAAEIKEEYVSVFEDMAKYGPQYSYEIHKPQVQIKVKLNKYGQKQYKSIYLHRPQYTKIENDIYYFDCSRSQAFQYFTRFGANAQILEPEDLREDLHKFFSNAERLYRKNQGHSNDL